MATVMAETRKGGKRHGFTRLQGRGGHDEVLFRKKVFPCHHCQERFYAFAKFKASEGGAS